MAGETGRADSAGSALPATRNGASAAPLPFDGPFVLGDWTVFPSRNRLVSRDRVVRLEPKVMDVLVVLARRAGRVVDRETLVDEAWGKPFLAESAVTRVVAALRRALGDDAKSPCYLETISKRGYRLIPAVEPAGGSVARSRAEVRRSWWVTALLLVAAVLAVTLAAIAAGHLTETTAAPGSSPPAAAGRAR